MNKSTAVERVFASGVFVILLSKAIMVNKNDIIAAVEEALSNESAIGFHRGDFKIDFDKTDTLILECEVDSVAAKKLALERAGAISGVSGIIDRVRVKPASQMTDNDIRTHLGNAILDDLSFADISIRERKNGNVDVLREFGDQTRGNIEIRVKGGVVFLNGEVPGLDFKRLAGVLAWWVPGSQDVINGLAVVPLEEDSPDMIEEAVRTALEKDPFVEAGQIRVGVRNRTVRLTGVLSSENQRHMAECDAWYVFGVDTVLNEIEILPISS